eukprot:7572723-Ditylum_brightwellii.AAC.1
MLSKPGIICTRSNARNLSLQSHTNGATRNKMLHSYKNTQGSAMGIPCRGCMVRWTSITTLQVIHRGNERESTTTDNRHRQIQAPWLKSANGHCGRKGC